MHRRFMCCFMLILGLAICCLAGLAPAQPLADYKCSVGQPCSGEGYWTSGDCPAGGDQSCDLSQAAGDANYCHEVPGGKCSQNVPIAKSTCTGTCVAAPARACDIIWAKCTP